MVIMDEKEITLKALDKVDKELRAIHFF